MFSTLRKRIADLIQPATSSRGYKVAKYNNLTHKQHARAKRETYQQLWTRDSQKLFPMLRDLVINEPVAMRCVDYRCDRTVGRAGPTPQLNTGSVQLDNQIEKAWKEFAYSTGATGIPWGDFCRVVYKEKFVVGESFITWFIDADARQVGFQIYEPEQLDNTGEFLQTDIGAGEYYAQGIAYNELNRPVRYYIRPIYAGTRGYTSAFGLDAKEISASNVCHYYDKERPSQFRGISKLATIAEQVFLVNDIDEAELQGKRKEAYWSVWLKTENDPDATIEGLQHLDENGVSTNPEPEYEFDMSAGAIQSGDYDIHTVDPRRPGSSYIEFTGNILRRCVTSLAVPYSAATGDTSGSNYSTERAIAMHCKPTWEADRKGFANRFCRFVFEKWLTYEALKNDKIKLGFRTVQDVCKSVVWQFDGYEWIDPKAEAEALKSQMELGLIGHSDACMTVGKDSAVQVQKIGEEIDAFAELGYMPEIYKIMISQEPELEEGDGGDDGEQPDVPEPDPVDALEEEPVGNDTA